MTGLAKIFVVYWTGEYPKEKKIYHKGVFTTRQKARSWCRQRQILEGLTIVHPDGSEEKYKSPIKEL